MVAGIGSGGPMQEFRVPRSWFKLWLLRLLKRETLANMLHFSKMQILGGDNNTSPHCTAMRIKWVAYDNISGPRLALSTLHMCNSHCYCYLQQCKTSTRFFFLVLCNLARKPKLTLGSLLLLNLDCKHAPPPQQDLILSIPLLTLLLINFLEEG